jgi:transcriptional regulator with XRE-family HTH domain
VHRLIFEARVSINRTGMAKRNASKAIAELAAEMAKPRSAASAHTNANLFPYFKGMYARVARKLNVSPSMVSRVANGHRVSPKIKKALLEEIEEIKQQLDSAS